MANQKIVFYLSLGANYEVTQKSRKHLLVKSPEKIYIVNGDEICQVFFNFHTCFFSQKYKHSGY